MKPRRSYVDGRFGQIHLQVAGSGPAILLNHQSGSSSDAFEAVYPLIAQAGFTVVGVDSPGMGNSDAPTTDAWSLDQFAEAGASAVEALGLGRVVVGGHHTGAGTSLRHAMLYPDRVRGLVLHQLLLLDEAARAHFASSPVPGIVPKADGSHLIEGWSARGGAAGDWTMVDPMNRGVLDLLRRSPAVARSFAAALAYDAEPDLIAVSCPVLNLSNTGDRSHPSAQKVSQLRPGVAYVEIAGGALDIMDERPREWADAVITFMRGLPA